jgi:hypothetical protein
MACYNNNNKKTQRLTNLLGDVVADVHLLVVQQHAVDSLNGSLGGLAGLIVHEAVTTRAALLVGGDLAREHIAEGDKGVVESLVIDLLVEVLDEDIALTGLAKLRVALRPHDAASRIHLPSATCHHDQIHRERGEKNLPCTALDEGIVELLQSTLTIGGIEEVDVGVAERTAGDRITAHTNATKQRWVFVFECVSVRCGSYLATGPIMLKISKSIASVTVGSSSPT